MKSLKAIFKKINPLTAIISAVTRARDADRYMQIMLEFMPLSASLWDAAAGCRANWCMSIFKKRLPAVPAISSGCT